MIDWILFKYYAKMFWIRNKVFIIIFAITSFILLIIFIISLIGSMMINTRNNNYIHYFDEINRIYTTREDLLLFDDNNTLKLTVEEINDIMSEAFGYYYNDVMLNDELDECLGYIIIKKNFDNTISVDDKHVCDMVDY